MALTNEEKERLLAVLDVTGGHRETMFKERVIPEDYKSCLERCDRKEMTLVFPSLDPVRVILTMPKKKQANAPLHINYHGGGFIFKQNGDDDMYCAHIAAAAGAVVVDVDYASSVDAPYPMAFNQAYETAKWAFAHCQEWGCDPKRLSVGGSSAGGNLAMAVSLKASETGDFPICLEILEYAATDNYIPAEHPEEMARSYTFSSLYVDGELEVLKEPYCSPAYATDEQLKRLPETLIIAPVQCPFYEINNELGMRMVRQGVPVTFRSYLESTHGSTVRMVGEWQQAQAAVIRAIKQTTL